MENLYFNELSVDFTLSVQPNNEVKAKELLLQLIQTYFAYKVSTGLENVYILSKERLSIKKIADVFSEGSFYKLLKELEEADEISDEQKQFFKAAISETFKPDWNPEYFYSDRITYGLGEACKNESYAVSYSTEIANTTDTWNSHLIPVKERTLTSNGILLEKPKISKNISSLNHVVVEHEIWERCMFTNRTPAKSLLPKKAQSEFIVKSLSNLNWTNFYINQQLVDVTTKIKIGRAIALINGWQECLTSDGRPTFNAKNRYIAVDTQHAAFEVYIGIHVHKGEMKFNDETIDTSKADPMRSVSLR